MESGELRALSAGKSLPADGKGMGLKLIAAWRENGVSSTFCELLPAQPHVLSFLVQKLAGVRMGGVEEAEEVRYMGSASITAHTHILAL